MNDLEQQLQGQARQASAEELDLSPEQKRILAEAEALLLAAKEKATAATDCLTAAGVMQCVVHLTDQLLA